MQLSLEVQPKHRAPKKPLILGTWTQMQAGHSHNLQSILREFIKHACKLQSMTLGKFIDMEIYLSEGYNKSIKDIIQTLWGVKPTEEFMISGVWQGIQSFISYRNSLYKNYTNLFGGDDDGYAKTEIKQTTDEIKKIWYDIILTLAEGKFLVIEQVTDKPLISAFNWLAWNKDKMEKQKEELKKNDLQRNNRHI